MGLLDTVWKSVRGATRGAARALAGYLQKVSALRPYLAGTMPGFWSSDHISESQRYTNFTYCAVTALCDQAAQATVTVYRTGGTKKAKDRRRRLNKRLGQRKKSSGNQQHQADDREPMDSRHPLVRLLNRPNPEQSGSSLRYQCMQQLSLHGTAHVWIIRNDYGTPVELYVIPTASAVPLPPSNEMPRGSYRVSPLASFSGTVSDDFLPPGSLGPLLTTGGIIDAKDVKSIRLPHPLYRSDGWSPLAAGALILDVEEQMHRARWYSLRNASVPGMVFEVAEDADPRPEEVEGFRQDLRNRNSGVQNAGKDLVLPKGFKPHQVNQTGRDLDFASGFPQIMNATLAIHKTPAVAIGVAEAGSYSAFYASLKQFTELSVQPKLSLIGEELTEALGPDFEKVDGLPDGERLEIAIEARAIDDPSTLNDRIRTDIQAKAVTINEVRELRGLEPVWWGDCPAGSDPIQWQQQLQQLKQGGQEGQPGQGGPPGEEGADDPLAALLEGLGGEDEQGGGPPDGGADGEDGGGPTPFDTGEEVPTRQGLPQMAKSHRVRFGWPTAAEQRAVKSRGKGKGGVRFPLPEPSTNGHSHHHTNGRA